ncbi:cation:proton antiporter regulatory subunit [Neptunomonas qingdaonensis]|uniref:cation:proton antiporter regulatory subunit n=1 Tax=Neptunomonas qingdaonensis TaxID=1045558 RepID=UPI001FD2BCF5|nr:TrkA C-terminal domain-containing protein [Neptunomonas qingdaonensis]
MRQRLTVSKGYGVSEIFIPEGSKFVGKSIKETNLREQDINILTLYRGAKSIPNPREDRILESNDKLLCFGKLESMRGMVPAKTRRRREPKISDLQTNVPEQKSDDNAKTKG